MESQSRGRGPTACSILFGQYTTRFLNFNRPLLCIFVCVCIHICEYTYFVCVCVHICEYTCVRIRLAKYNLICHSQPLPSRKVRSLAWCSSMRLSWLARGARICVALLPRIWHDKCPPSPCLLFHVGSGDRTLVLMLPSQGLC